VPAFPAQTYALDPAHTSVIFSVDHLGFSRFTASFDEIAGSLALDTAAPEAAQLDVSIEAASLDLPKPPPGFRATLLGPGWLDAGANPRILYRSTRVVPGPESSARIEGVLTLRGVARPVTLSARFNGAWPGPPYEPGPRLGFSATGHFRRSDFGVDQGVPPPGSDFGVGDLVEVRIETEWTGPTPPWAGPGKAR
jgi:polyisoprenoid-binding protein YceI